MYYKVYDEIIKCNTNISLLSPLNLNKTFPISINYTI